MVVSSIATEVVVNADHYLMSEPRYEDTYGHFMEMFELVSCHPALSVSVTNVPWSWVAVLHYMGVHLDLDTAKLQFASCALCRGAIEGRGGVEMLTRADVDVLSTVRPETADSLWREDNVWLGKRRRLDLCTPSAVRANEPHGIVVTTNAAQYRPEVLRHLDLLHSYRPPSGKDKVLMIPCSADKPYPNELQKTLISMLPDDSWYLMVVSGVLGLVPQSMFATAPEYDAGIPMHWRVYEEVQKYFTRIPHSMVVCASDFYAHTIFEAGLGAALGVFNVAYVFPTVPRYDYEDLRSEENLEKIRTLLQCNI